MKKCPICNSKKITQSKQGFKCKNCGYVNTKYIEVIPNKKQVKIHKEKISKTDSLYNKVMKVFINHRNDYIENSLGDKSLFNEFCIEFEDMLKGIFEEEDILKKRDKP